MGITFKHIRRLSTAGLALLAFGQLSACVTDDVDPDPESEDSSGGASGSSGANDPDPESGGQPDGTAGTPSTGATKCASPIALDSSTPGIADFEGYDGEADLSTWSFALGGDSATGVFAGPFGYGDDHVDPNTQQEMPELFEMVEGNDSTYALSISDTMSEQYGGGMGIWLSECLNASAFTGISFSARGSAPTGEATLSVMMEQTTMVADEGTCTGTDDDCAPPKFAFAVTDDWTEIQAPFSDFEAGTAEDTLVPADGSNIWQIQFDVGLEWLPDDTGEYMPTAGEYELVIDDLTFY